MRWWGAYSTCSSADNNKCGRSSQVRTQGVLGSLNTPPPPWLQVFGVFFVLFCFVFSFFLSFFFGSCQRSRSCFTSCLGNGLNYILRKKKKGVGVPPPPPPPPPRSATFSGLTRQHGLHPIVNTSHEEEKILRTPGPLHGSSYPRRVKFSTGETNFVSKIRYKINLSWRIKEYTYLKVTLSCFVCFQYHFLFNA